MGEKVGKMRKVAYEQRKEEKASESSMEVKKYERNIENVNDCCNAKNRCES